MEDSKFAQLLAQDMERRREAYLVDSHQRFEEWRKERLALFFEEAFRADLRFVIVGLPGDETKSTNE